MVRLTSSDADDDILSDRCPVEGRGTVWRDLLTPAAKAVLLASGAVVGVAAVPGPADAQTNHVTTTPDAGPSTNLSNLVDEASSSVGDFDGDGDLDLLVTGYDGGGGTATIYENDGDGNFTNAGVALPGVENGSTSVGDFDGDGDLDILITGRANVGDIARIYENTGGFSFSQVASLTGVDRGDTSVGDFDGDGDLDLLIAGYAGTNRTAKIYENTGQNAGSGSLDGSTFQEVNAGLTGVKYASTSVGDFDGDGDLDLLITGFYEFGQSARIYENGGDENGDLTDFTQALSESGSLTGVDQGASSVGDFDGDGDLDLVVIGGKNNAGQESAKIYENGGDEDGDLTDFSEVASLGNGIDQGSVSVGDFDGDGDLDLLVSGYYYYNSTSYYVTRIYENTGQNAGSGSLDGSTFQDVGASLPGLYKSTSSVGDFDGDGDLDYFLAGDYGPGSITQIVENQSPSTLTITGTDGTGNDVGWRMLSFPSAVQLQDLEDDFVFSFQGISSGNVVHVWDATNQEWSPVTNDTDVIPPEDGIMIYLFDDTADPVTSAGLPITTPSVGNARTERTLSGLGPGRFVLVGNPYLKAYDLNELPLDANGFQQSVQVYDPATGSYQTLTQGADNVAAMQGMVLERTTPGEGATSLTFPASGIRSGEGTLIKSAEDPSAAQASSMRAAVLQLTVEDESGTTVRDRARVLFHEEATAGWDAYEATQFSKPGNGPSATLASPTERNGTLVMRTQASVPVPTEEATVPLSVASEGASGTATLSLGDAPDGWTVEVEDTATGETMDLGEGPHTFSLSEGNGSVSAPGEARFVLHAGPAEPDSPERAPEDLEEALVRAFTARVDGSGALLTWEAATKSGTEGFEVHRMVGSPGTGMFEKVGFVKADGTSSKAQAYRFHTDRLSPGTHRFRLKQVGADGSGTYTETVTVQVQIDGQYRLVPPSPNPSEGPAQMRLTVAEGQPVTVAVYDVLGRRVQTAFDRTLSGQTERAIPVGEDLPSGTYLIRVKGEQFTATERLTIVK